MLSIFPTLLAYPLAGTALLRVTAGIVCFFLGFRALRSLKGNFSLEKLAVAVAAIEVAAGVFLTIGLFTQAAALVIGIVSLLVIFLPKKETSPGFGQTLFYILLAGVSFSILFLGPGTLAFDLPL